MLIRTSSLIWGRWYFPMFLFRNILLALMYNASLMVLMRFWSSLPTMLKLSVVVVWPVVLKWSYIGEEAFRCFLNLSPNVLDDSNIFFITILPVTFISVNDPTLLDDEILSLGATRRLLMVIPPLRYTCTPCLLNAFLRCSFSPLV